MSISPRNGARGLQRLSHLKYYNVLYKCKEYSQPTMLCCHISLFGLLSSQPLLQASTNLLIDMKNVSLGMVIMLIT